MGARQIVQNPTANLARGAAKSERQVETDTTSGSCRVDVEGKFVSVEASAGCGIGAAGVKVHAHRVTAAPTTGPSCGPSSRNPASRDTSSLRGYPVERRAWDDHVEHVGILIDHERIAVVLVVINHHSAQAGQVQAACVRRAQGRKRLVISGG